MNLQITRESPEAVAKVLCQSKGIERGSLYRDYREPIRNLCIQNANTIPSSLQRVAIASEVVMAFARRLLPLQAFSTVFRNVRLDGTNDVSVPYYPIDSSASTDWNSSNGYVMGDRTASAKTVTVNKRKYQPVRWTSEEFARQPYLNVEKLAIQAADKLAYDFLSDVLSVITAANYSTAAHVGIAANFGSDDIATIRRVCSEAHWPVSGRSLVVTSAYEEYLLRDPNFVNALNYGSNGPIQAGVIPKVFGFGFIASDVIPSNSENLTGFAAFNSGILIASSPIKPAAELADRVRYDLFTDPQTSITLEHRVWGDADMDQTREVIEVNYGYAVGEAAAIKRITSA